MPKKPKCVMILTEGKSDRAALTDFFTDLYSLIDEDIEVFFPLLSEECINEYGQIELKYDGDITSRYGIEPTNILPLLLKLFIHPEFQKHPAYKYPSSVCEVIHLVDIDGVYIRDDRVLTDNEGKVIKRPVYDLENNLVLTRDRNKIIDRNQRKRANLEKLIETKRLRITMAKDENETKEKPYRVYYFSANLDHVLFGKPNNPGYNKVDDANDFANQYYDDVKGMAKFFLDNRYAVKTNDYLESLEMLKKENETLIPRTNINILIQELVNRAKIKL